MGDIPSPAGRVGPIAGIEGIRGLAALGVLVFHVWSYGDPTGQPPAFVGAGPLMRLLPASVTLFFALSGFLLYRPFARAIIHDHALPELWRYSRKRGLRILPAYWTVLLVIGVLLPAGILDVSHRPFELGRLTQEPLLLAADVALVQNYFPDGVFTGIGPAWSLVVEMAFYIVLPLLAIAAARAARGRSDVTARLSAALAPAALLFVVGMTAKLAVMVVGGLGRWYEVVTRSPVYHADLFSYGMLAAVVIHIIDRPAWLRPAFPVAVGGVLASLWLVETGVLPGGLFESSVAACTAIVVLRIAAGLSANHPVARVLAWQPLVGVGLASYSLYLWHEPVVHLAQSRGWTAAGVDGFIINLIGVAAVSLALAAITYRLVEAPAQALSARADPNRGLDGPDPTAASADRPPA